jgi:hypothetical protein
MTLFADYFKPETVFSMENPFLKSAEAAHRLVFDAFERTARAQLRFADDLLTLNRDRFELMYAGKSFSETLDAQQDLVAEFGKRAVDYAGDLREVAASVFGQASEAAMDAANDLGAGPERKPTATKTKKKAA